MICRREFLRTIGAAGLVGAGLGATSCSAAPPARRLNRIGLQLYTVRSSMADSVERTLERVAQIGYDDVEFAGYLDRSPQQIRRVLDETGLSAPASHVPLEQLEDGWEALVDNAAVLDHRYLVVAWIPPQDRTALDDYRRFAERFNRVGERARAAGITFGYHNHDFEFQALEGQRPWDVLIQETDPALVKFELDLYWITKAGVDPVTYLGDGAQRYPLVHVKDMAADGSMVDVGAGTIDFARLFALGAGIRHYFVEHDNPGDPFTSVAASYRHLRGLEY